MNHGAKDLWLLKYMKKLMACRDEFIEQNKVRKSPTILFRIGFSKRTVGFPIYICLRKSLNLNKNSLFTCSFHFTCIFSHLSG